MMEWEDIELTDSRGEAPRKPVLQPVENFITTMMAVPHLRLDNAMRMPARPVLEPKKDEETLSQIPELKLNEQNDLVCP
jgi:hypothetical protein